MKRKLRLAAALAVAVCLLSVTAYAYHDHLGQRREPVMGPLEAVANPSERPMIDAVFMGDRVRLEVLHGQMAAARKALIAKLLSPDRKIDVTKELAQLKHSQDALLDERVERALKARALMSPQELSEAFQLWTKWQRLREQERSLFEDAASRHAGEH
jgi:hypothetical protein